MNENITFGQLVKERRGVLGLTQTELARRVGCAAITIRKIEADDLRPSVQMAELIALALNTPEEEQLPFIRLARSERALSPIPTPSPAPGEIGLTDLSGRAVKGFQLGEKIGSGGFGVVYRAIQSSVERDVAVKIILPRYANHPNFIRRFEAEAQLIARLEHPHIVPLYDYWREPDAAYLIMRLLRGGSLEDQLKSGPIPIDMVRQYTQQIGMALDVAHRHGVIHRDIKPANVLLDEEANAYLADFGIAIDLDRVDVPSLTADRGLIGSPAYFSPEQILAEPVKPPSDIYCFGIMLFEMLTGSKPFPGPTPVAFIQQHLKQSFPSLLEFSPDLPPQLDAVIYQATARNPADRFQDVPSLLLALQQALPGPPSSTDSVWIEAAGYDLSTQEMAALENPYKGLRAFAEADAGNYYGRDTLIQEILASLSEPSDLARFLAIVGPSGSGKSSAAKAGLVPALRRGGLPGSENWYVLDIIPGAHPWEEVEAALLRVAVNPPESLLGQLQESDRGLLRAVQRILPNDSQTELLLLIDQFEEIFTLVEDEVVREHFLNSLITAVLDDRSRLRIVITLRADFYDRPLQYVDFGDLLRQQTVSLLPMTPDELEEAITQPAEQAGVWLEEGLAAEIIRDVGNQPGTLPLLQYVLTELFDQREGNMMTRAAYREAGGVTGALARRADEIYEGLDDAGRAASRQLFLRLITLGEGVEDTRRRVRLSELEALSTEGNPNTLNSATAAEYKTLISEYGRYRLLTFDRDPITREPTVEVAHEALLREWNRLRDWLAESRDDIRRLRLLAEGASQWTSAEQDDSYLLHGNRLTEFAAWAEITTLALTGPEWTFLDASVNARRQREAAEETRRQNELAAAQRLAETERIRAEEQSQAAQRLRRRALFLVGALILAAILAVVAVGAGRQAIRNADDAQINLVLAVSREAEAVANFNLAATQESLAHENADLAAARQADAQQNANIAATRQAEAETEAIARATAEAEAIFEQEKAQQQANLATSRELSLAAITNLESDPELGILLALQALDTSYTKQAEEALHQSIQTSRLLMTLSDHTGRIYGSIYSPDGSKLASVSDDGTVKVWKAASGHLTRSMPYDGIEYVGSSLMFDGSGDKLALVAVGDNFESVILHIWNASSGKLLSQKELPIAVENFNLALSPDWKQIVTGRENGTVELWDVEIANKIVTFSGHEDIVDAVSFNPDGSRLVTISNDGQVMIWDIEASLAVADGQLIASFVTPNDTLLKNARFSSDSTRLALGFADSDIEVWNLADTSQLQFILSGHNNVSNLFAFHPDDTYLATGGADSTAKIWDLNSGEELITLSGHKGFINRLNYSPDGSRLVTAGTDGTVRIWNIEPQAGGELLTFSSSPAFDLELSPDEQKVALGSTRGPATVWDSTTGEQLLTLPGEAETAVYRVAFNPDGSAIAAVGEDGNVRIWDSDTGELLLAFSGHTEGRSGGFFEGILDVSYSPDGTRLATAGADGFAKVWDAETGENLLTLAGHTAGLHSLAYSPDGHYIATSSDSGDTSVKVWDALTGAELHSFGPNPGRAWGLAFSPDSDLLGAAGQGGYIKVWDMISGEEVSDMTGQASTIATVIFTADGQQLISGGADSASIWDVKTGTELLNLAPKNSWKAALTRDGRQLYTAGPETASVRVYTILLEDAVALAQSKVTRSLTEAECRQYLHLEKCPESD